MEDFDTICYCSLNRIFGFEPAIARRLVDFYGGAGAIFRMNREELSGILGPFSKYIDRIGEKELDISAKELESLKRDGYSFIPYGSGNYPLLLQECDDAPMGLYIRSGTEIDKIFNTAPCISVVGTRDISPYGSEWCRRIVGAMATAQIKPVIVSGLAVGVDITAHETAIDNGLATIAVMATGVDAVYPARHKGFALRMEHTRGCALISDYPPCTAPVAVNFLRRNRIIAGLSTATILIESKEKGGGMVTADIASSYNREVYALPGRIDDIRSQGCNRLIRGKIAEPVTDLDNFVNSLGLGTWSRRTVKDLDTEILEKYGNVLDDGLLAIIRSTASLIKKYRGATLEELCNLGNINWRDMTYAVGMLENDGIISVDLLQRCSINVKKD